MKKFLLFLTALSITAWATERPNVIIVFTDDQGYGDLSCHGNPILETPHFDKLYSESVRFDNFHVAPVCTPSRSELMTGLYAMRNKAVMVPSGRNLMRRDIVTMPEVFAANGYATGLFGKWHLGDTYPHRPMDRGFQRVVWHKGWGLASEIEYDNDYYYTRYLDEMEVKYSDRFCANLWFDEAMKWMDQQIEAKQPFFSYIALNTPHSPFHALEEDYNKYKEQVEDPNVAHFFGLISNADDNYGRLDRWLERRGIKDDTIIVFMNDNGSSRGDKIYNAGMRGKKGSGYEGGHRAICFIRWPNGGLGTPRTVNNLSHITDILPTFADLLDFDVPQTGDLFDGVSLKPILRNVDTIDDNRKVIVQFGGRVRPQKYYRSCVIWKNWRLNGESELFDLGKDPGQKKDVSAQYPEIVRELKRHYDAYWASIEASIDVIEPMVIGYPVEPYTDLTSNNWIEVDFDNRGKVAGAESMGGIWEIEVEKDGEYLVRLSRWPFYMDRPLSSIGPAETIGGMPIDPGKALPIESGSLSVNGEEPIMAEPNAGVTFIEMRIELSKGRHALQGWFHDAQGTRLSGAFYGRVIRQ